jgi:hypothetical protein
MMIVRIQIIIYIFFLPWSAVSQLKNLVINGDFEAEEFCIGIWIEDNEILGWGQQPSVDQSK